ncbi:hypothetical protein ZWY2020_031223 [Hordeum vulgare]|nr:hypothetical protein ZWY2020_031223 [Hordeum vulgare]
MEAGEEGRSRLARGDEIHGGGGVRIRLFVNVRSSCVFSYSKGPTQRGQPVCFSSCLTPDSHGFLPRIEREPERGKGDAGRSGHGEEVHGGRESGSIASPPFPASRSPAAVVLRDLPIGSEATPLDLQSNVHTGMTKE